MKKKDEKRKIRPIEPLERTKEQASSGDCDCDSCDCSGSLDTSATKISDVAGVKKAGTK